MSSSPCSSDRWHRTMPRPARYAFYGIFGLFFTGLVATVLGYVTMSLWNVLLPALFSWPTISFWQAVGILILARLLTGRFSSGYRGGGRFRRWRQTEPYAAWWEAEGEAAFKAYLRRTSHETDTDDSHGG